MTYLRLYIYSPVTVDPNICHVYIDSSKGREGALILIVGRKAGRPARS